LVIPLAVVVLIASGCSGCNSQATTGNQTEEELAEQKKKQLAEKKKLEDLEIKPLLPLLGQEPMAQGDDGEALPGVKPILLVKPGHWTTTIQEMKANYDDFVGTSSTTLVDSQQRPVPLADTSFTFRSTRPVALAKGRAKRVESEMFVPEQSQGVQVQATLSNRRSGYPVEMPQPVLQKMPSYQYFIVVLSEEISKYGFLKVTDAVRMPWEEELDTASQPHYRVVLADATKSLPLPSNPLTWSSVAHFVWDEVDPTRMTPEQQSALVDWIHWGGRLIINGPDSLDALRGSFLDELLPADQVGPRTLTAADLSEWSDYWSRRDRGQRPPPLKPAKPWSGIELKPRAGTAELAGGSKLFYERIVGRGTIVLSAVQLSERDLINWPGYDSFLNAALLQRPRRVFSEGPYGGAQVGWSEYPERRLDAHFATGLRFFARDSGAKANQWRVSVPEQNPFGQINESTSTKIDRRGGVGTWSSFTPISNAARQVLTDAAAVRVPGAGFVLACLSFYLIVLVPLNWMVFRTLNRVEWAWIAAPLIALLGTLVIVRQAQLDIGFVRSQTEVALLELQNHRERGLLSRFTALYSSLSTTYEMTYQQPTTVATPFPAQQRTGGKNNERTWDVVFEKQKETRLSGLAVSSASTKMVHSEEIFELEGPLLLGKSSRGHDQLENRSGYDLRDVVVLRRFFTGRSAPKYESTWIGELRNGTATVVGLKPIVLLEDQVPHQEERQQAASERGVRIDVDGLMNIAFQFPEGEDPLQQARDEIRVVGLIDQVLPGSEVSPSASQINGTTVVLAHLEFGALPRPEPDVNSRSDVIKPPPKN
jgi:hypothetical protein